MIVAFDDPDLTKAYTREVDEVEGAVAVEVLLELAREAHATDQRGVRGMDNDEDFLRDQVECWGRIDGEPWEGS